MGDYLRRLKELFRAMRAISSGYGRGSRAVLWARMILTVLHPRLPRALRRAQRLDLAMNGKLFCIWMLDRTGLAAFEEVFIRREYFVPDLAAPEIIVDVGANIGVASVYFCVRYPEARVYAVEPDPIICNTLKKNLAAFPNASVHQCALSDIDGTVDFHVHPDSSIASSLDRRVPGGKVISVPSKTLDTFMEEQQIPAIDLLKFDIEGAEDRMLRAIKNRRAVRSYVGEIHPDLMDASLQDIVALFKGFSIKTSPVGAKRFLLTAIAR